MSMNKRQALNYLQSRGLNTHQYIVPSSFNELRDFVLKYGLCSIRFDKAICAVHLPFYMIEQFEENQLLNIWNESRACDCSLIVSNGHSYEKDLMFNMAVQFDKQGEFMFDLGMDKVALRDLYKGDVLSIVGNVFDMKGSEYDIVAFGIDAKELADILFQIYGKDLCNRLVEVSYYSRPVGVLSERLVYWQV